MMVDDLRKALELLDQMDDLLSGYPEWDDEDYPNFENASEKLRALIVEALQRREKDLTAFVLPEAEAA